MSDSPAQRAGGQDCCERREEGTLDEEHVVAAWLVCRAEAFVQWGVAGESLPSHWGSAHAHLLAGTLQPRKRCLLFCLGTEAAGWDPASPEIGSEYVNFWD